MMLGDIQRTLIVFFGWGQGVYMGWEWEQHGNGMGLPFETGA